MNCDILTSGQIPNIFLNTHNTTAKHLANADISSCSINWQEQNKQVHYCVRLTCRRCGRLSPSGSKRCGTAM